MLYVEFIAKSERSDGEAYQVVFECGQCRDVLGVYDSENQATHMRDFLNNVPGVEESILEYYGYNKFGSLVQSEDAQLAYL